MCIFYVWNVICREFNNKYTQTLKNNWWPYVFESSVYSKIYF